MIHNDPHPLASHTVTVTIEGETYPYRIEDWADRVIGQSWQTTAGHAAAMQYAMRSGLSAHLPIDDEVLYGKIGYFGQFVHISEITDENPRA